MRYVETSLPLALAAVLLCAACTSVDDAPKTETRPAAVAAAPAVKAIAAAPAASAASAPAKPAVDPAVQRAFDGARLALNAGRTDQAERAFRALTQSNPELGGPHANLGLIYRKANKLPEAATEFEQAVRLSPDQPVYYNELGVTYRLQGQFTKAREAYEKAIALDPNYAAAVLNLGILNDIYLWDAPRALVLYERYLALTPGGDATVTKWVADLKNRKPQQKTVSKTASNGEGKK
jgi:tetratricopeptide (TPR) repeat protein